ncbi:MAG: hypothetical protein SVV03_06190 [Candidatus Nanohaloarchaea archaeon]|nr:hypothetical protein [Candidatus Nanohaloarchaea archaeon]
MDILEPLRKNLTEESKAYGYTLSVWGSGALLLNFYSFDVLNILLYILGAVAGFALLALLAFKGFFSNVETKRPENFIVASMVHIFAAFGNVFLSWAILLLLQGALSPLWAFFIIGVHVSFSYNALLLLEEFLSEYIVAIEARIAGELA